MENLNQSVLTAALHSVGLERTNNKNDITVLKNSTVRILANYKKTVDVDREKHKARITTHKTGRFSASDTLLASKKTEYENKLNTSKSSITGVVNTKVSEVISSGTTTLNTIIAMQDAIGADTLNTTTVAKTIGVGNPTTGTILGGDLLSKDELVLGLPSGSIFAVNYLDGDISDIINDNKPDGIENVVGYTGTGTFHNSDNTCCGQMVLGEGCWFGIGSENMMSISNRVRSSSDYSILLEAKEEPEKMYNVLADFKLNGGTISISNMFRQDRWSPGIHPSSYDIFATLTAGNYTDSADKSFFHLLRRDMEEYGLTYMNTDRLSNDYFVGTNHILFKPWDRSPLMRYLRFDSDGRNSFNHISRIQVEFSDFKTPFILNKRKQTEITYQDITEEVV